MEFLIEKCVMLIIRKKKQLKELEYLIRKTSDTLRQRKLQVPVNIRNRHHQANKDERKSKKGIPEEQNFSNPNSAVKISSKE